MVKVVKFLFFAQKVSSGSYGGITSQIFRGLAALEPPPPQNGGQRFFFVFNRKHFLFPIENKKENGKKYFVHFVGNLSRIQKLFFFSSIKTEEVLFFYIYI